MSFIFGLPGVVWSLLRRLTWKQVLTGAAVVGGWLLLMIGRSQGRAGEKAKEAARKAEAVEDMKEIKDEVEGMPDAARRDELRRFVRRD
jgi:hypothetical protein